MAAAGPTEPPPPPGTVGAYFIPPPPPGRERRWLPVITLFLVLLFIVFGGYFVAARSGVTVPSGQAQTPMWVTVGGIRFRPAPGWVIARRIPGPEPAAILTRGIGSLLVLPSPSPTDPADALDSYVDDVLQPEAVDLHVSDTTEEVELPGGFTGLRRAYLGRFVDNPSPLEGQATAFALPGGPTVVFDGWAQEGSYQTFAGEVDAMAGTTEAR
jgi:hypothetical protein